MARIDDMTPALKSRRGLSDAKSAVALAVAGIVVIGFGIGFSVELTNSNDANQADVQSAVQSLQTQIQVLQHQASVGNLSAPYQLTIVITGNDPWNSTLTQPMQSVLTPGGLVSSAKINLPAHRTIQLTIEDFDTPTPLPSQYATVNGTVGDSVTMLNITASSQNPTNATNFSVVKSLNPQDEVAHTFTIPQLGINIPSAPMSVEVANFMVNETGSFVWHCEDPCGFGPTGQLGAMSTPGWMFGTLNFA